MRKDLRRTLLLASALTSTVILGAPAFAQDAATGPDQAEPQPQAPTTGNEIIVTARRFEERLQDVPISITVFSQEDLANRNIVNPSELATYTPSLSVNRQFSSEKSTFSIRGFTQELGTQPSVAVYFADVVAPRAQGFTGGGNGTFPGTLFDLQSVQVLKGPQGTLFGRNTTGGAVLLVPQKPTDKAEGYVEASLGNHDSRRVQAVVNAPLGDRARFRIGVDRMTRDGYLHNQSGIGPSDFANVDYWSVRGSLVVDVADNLENYTVATFNDSNTHGQLPRIIACIRNPTQLQFLASFGCAQLDRQAARGDGFYDVENDVADPIIHLKQWQVINTTTWDPTDTLTVKNIASYAEYRERDRFNIFGDRLVLGPIPPFVPAALPFRVSAVEPGPSGSNVAQYTVTEELQVQGHSADRRLVYQAGGYIEISNPLKANTQINQLFLNCANAPALQGCVSPLDLGSPIPLGAVGLLDQKFRFRNLAAYAQATYKITDQFSVTGGIRYTRDRIRARAQNATARFRPGPAVAGIACSKTGVPLASFAANAACRESFVEKSSKPTWLIDVDFKPNDDVLLYAKYARGYRQGTINLLSLSNNLTSAGPEKVDTYEIGAKTSFDGPIRGSFNIAGFYNNFSGQQLQANAVSRIPGVFPINVVVNAGKSRIYGVEIDASLIPFEGLRLDAAYSYLNTKLQSIDFPDLSTDPNYSGLVATAVVGGPLVYSPKNRVTLTGTYTLPIEDSIGRISFGATYTHTDRQFSTHADDAFAAQLGFNPGLLPATDLLNLNVNWDSVAGGPVDLSLFATNVTKEKYRVAVTQGGQLGFETALIGEPRIYGIRARVRFGD
ncbi:MAG: TonB-dependent receptor [Novosphingobium sp.]